MDLVVQLQISEYGFHFFFPVKSCKGSSSYITLKVISNKTKLIFIAISL
jgi:hypothetical protein